MHTIISLFCCFVISCLNTTNVHIVVYMFTLAAVVSIQGVCQASQVADLFPSISPEVVVREARLDDSWEVVETHCSSFFPEYSFPLDFVMRLDRLMAMVFGFSVPHGCKRTCLVAIIGSAENTIYIESDDLNFGGFDTKFSLNRGHVAGILTVDTVADFLPRKGPLRQRRCVPFNLYYVLVLDT